MILLAERIAVLVTCVLWTLWASWTVVRWVLDRKPKPHVPEVPVGYRIVKPGCGHVKVAELETCPFDIEVDAR